MMILGLAAIFLLIGSIILFLVSFVYHIKASKKKIQHEKLKKVQENTLSKAA